MMRPVALLCIGLSAIAFPQKREVSVEWMLTEGAGIAAVPQTRWLDNGRILVLDPPGTVPRRLRTWNALSGEWLEAFQMSAAIDSLRSVGGPALETLGMPIDIDESGRFAVYRFANDLFLLDIPLCKFRRITSTEAEEKNPRISPDGKRIAYVRDNNLWYADVPGNITRQLTFDGSKTILNGTLSWVYWEEIFGRKDTAVWWSPDSNAVAFLQTDESPVDVTLHIDHRAKPPRASEQRYPKPGRRNPLVRAGVYDFQTDKTKWVSPPRESYEYLLRVKWLPNGRRLALMTLNRAQTDLDLWFVGRDGSGLKKIFTEHDDAYVNVTDDLHFILGGDQFIWGSERSGMFHLYRFDEEGRLLNAVTSGNYNLVSNPGAQFWLRQTICAVDQQAGWVYFTTNRDDPRDRQLYRIKIDGAQLERVTKQAGVYGVSFNSAGDRFVATHSSLTQMPSVAAYAADGSLIEPIALPRTATLQAIAFSQPEFVTIPARDGFKMPGIIRKPVDFDPAKRYPVIFSVYGGPSAPSVTNAWKNPGWDQVLANNGYIVLTFDNRTATSVSKKYEAASLMEYMGTVETNDLIDAAKWIKSQAYVDPARIGIWGWSNGGTYVLLGLMRTKEFKAGISVAGIADQALYNTKWTESVMRSPDVNADGYRKTNNALRAKDLSGALLLIHGGGDDNVHPQQLWTMVDALIEAGKSFQMMVYPMRGHGIGDAAAQRHLYKTMLEFWKANL